MAVVDLGTQESTWQGKVSKRRKVLLKWELDEAMADGRPFIVTARYTASLAEKAVLRAHLEAWRGKAFTAEELRGFDLGKLLGAPCMVTLVQNGEYVNVQGVSKLPKGMAPLMPTAPLTLLDLDNFSPEVFATLSDGLKATIQKAPEYSTPGTDAEQPDHQDGPPDAGDIPF